MPGAKVYDFSKHAQLRGYVAARSSEELMRTLSRKLRDAHCRHAATGLGGAWLLTQFAMFRTVTFYVEPEPDSAVLEACGFRESPEGANVWLITPNDKGVFDGCSEHDGIPCVHPAQAWLDLRFHPERSGDAAERVRAQFLTWPANG
jgi:hypothetical protein